MQDGAELSRNAATAIKLLAMTACRKGEILGLKWAWVLYSSEATITRALSRGCKVHPSSKVSLLDRGDHRAGASEDAGLAGESQAYARRRASPLSGDDPYGLQPDDHQNIL